MRRNGAMHEPPDPLVRIDAIAAAALSGNSLERYHAYKKVLLDREKDRESVVSTLTLFVLDLSEALDRPKVTLRPKTKRRP